MSLAHGRVEARLPAKDLARAKRWYAGDNYPSRGRAERGAWFQDSEGNMLGIGQAIK